MKALVVCTVLAVGFCAWQAGGLVNDLARIKAARAATAKIAATLDERCKNRGGVFLDTNNRYLCLNPDSVIGLEEDK